MLFGEYLVRKGYCTESDVEQALALQRAGDQRLVGRILLDTGKVTWEQIDETVAALRKPE